jgi:hypothetical protein
VGKAEAVTQVARLMAAFRQEQNQQTVEIYVEKLQDVNPPLLTAAVERVIERGRFFPSIAEVRYAAAELTGLLPPTPAEMLAIIRRADRTEIRGAERGGRGYVEKFWDWPADLHQGWRRLAEDTLAKVGEPSDADGKPLFGWETGFQKTYEVAREAETVEVTQKCLAWAHPVPKRIGAGSGPTQVP